MKFGIILPNYGEYCDVKLFSEAALAAEEEGFDHVLVWDHYALPWSKRTFEAWSLLAFLAGRTSRIRLGTCVTPIPFRSPAHLAKIVATVDVLSAGRVILGVGAGWNRSEFRGFSSWDDGATRVAKTREGLDLVLKLWSEGKVDFEGRFYSAKGAVVEPKPVQKPHPPLWFGTRGEHMMRMLAEYGDGWIPIKVSARDYGRRRERIEEWARRYNRRGRLEYVCDANASTDVNKITREIERYGKAGCDYYSPAFEYPRGELVKRVRWFAKNIASSFS
ncbi:MAG: LLM class flavin-dependent oxidoreductase [Thaumarchaeota archaeon]|nr:LLM class flavin-dependent oxidoreductase [Nitrososphaerota archaeon]